jgi:hypothetical protein
MQVLAAVPRGEVSADPARLSMDMISSKKSVTYASEFY